MLNLVIKNHMPLREIVYEELKMRILKGEIVPGTRMMEVEMAEEMGVSRTPIREAIRKLEKEGLVIIEPRRGAYVSQISNKDMVEILEVRQTLDGLAARFAAMRMSEKEKLKLVELADSYNRAVVEGNTADMIKFDSAFHKLIVEGSDNRVLVNMVEQLQEMVLRFRYLYYEGFKRGDKMPAEHQAILESILKGDVDSASDAADVHIARLKELVEKES